MEKNLHIMFNSAEKKVLPKTCYPFGRVEYYTLYVAKNATESCQFSVLSKYGDRKNLRIEVVDNTNAGIKIQLLREHYVSCEGALWPDPVVCDDGHFDLQDWKNVTYRINVSTTPDTVAGNYELKVKLYENDELYGEYFLWVKIWNFTLKTENNIATSFGIDKNLLFKYHKTDNREITYKNYYDALLNNYHICGRYLPYDILDSRADEYMSNPLVKSFHVPCKSVSDETLKKYYEKLSSNPVWLEKATFYSVDTPDCIADYERLEKIDKRLDTVFPNHTHIIPFYTDPKDQPDTRAVDLLEKYNIVWCPKINLFKDEWFKYYISERAKKGEKCWWYCCWEPQLPYANLFIDMQGFYHRILLWQQYLYGIKGFLYYNTTHWIDGNPWDVTTSVPNLSHYCFGDGSLFYNGDRVGIDGPVGSVRLEILRSAIEDYNMFVLAEQVFGREYVEGEIKKVTTSVREYNDDHHSLAQVRIEIGEKLDEYYNNK